MKKTDLYKSARSAVVNQMKNSAPQPKGANKKNCEKKLNPLLASLLKKPE
jgi:hypothetical protein